MTNDLIVDVLRRTRPEPEDFGISRSEIDSVSFFPEPYGTAGYPSVGISTTLTGTDGWDSETGVAEPAILQNPDFLQWRAAWNQWYHVVESLAITASQNDVDFRGNLREVFE